MGVVKGAVLFVGQAYYQAWYLSRELRKLGWKADVLNWDLDDSNQSFYHGEDFRFKASTPLEEQLNFYKNALEEYDVFHFTNAHCLKFGNALHELFAARQGPYSEIRLLKARGKKIVYTNNGCPDGVSPTRFNKWKPYPNCEICRWKDVPEICSDQRNLEWGQIRNELADYQCIFGGNRADYNDDPRIHEEPSCYCLDPEFWKPDLVVPTEYQFNNDTVKIYHAVGNYDLRSSSGGKNIKCSHIYLPLIEQLKAEGYPVELVFAKDVPNKQVRFLQVQADIIVDMLTFGFFGANVREGLMLGKPCVCFLRPEWLASMAQEVPDYISELPVVSATPETIYEVLVDLINNSDKRKELGIRGREFALKWHSAAAGAKRFDQIYSALIDGKDVPPISRSSKWERLEQINAIKSQHATLLSQQSSRTEKRILLVLNHPLDPSKLRATIRDHIYCFEKYSGCRVDYFNLHDSAEGPADIQAYDLILFHTVFLSARWDREGFRRLLDLPAVQALKQSRAIKVALPQDEFLNTDILCDFIGEFGIRHVFSVAPPSEWPAIYYGVDRSTTAIHQVLTGYLDEDTLNTIDQISQEFSDRPIDIGYRAWRAAYWLGRHGQLKWQIADAFKAAAPPWGFEVDISTDERHTLMDNDWYRFMVNCRYFIGVEGGASILDRDGSIKACTEAYLERFPHATFDEVEQACFPGRDGSFQLFAISPRNLEACATRTCQVLVEGTYNGILRPWDHYIPVKPDFSNLDEVFAVMHDENLRLAIVERAYADVVASGRYSYRQFVKTVLEAVSG